MKILVVGDLHGQKPVIKFKDFDCIVQIGDVCDDSGFRPYYNKFFKLLSQGKDSPDVNDMIVADIGKRGFNKLITESLAKGHEILKYLNSFGKPVFFVPGNWDESYGKTKIKNIDASVYNYVKSFYDNYLSGKANKKLLKGLKNIRDCHFQNYSFNGINFIGYGLSSGPELLSDRNSSTGLSAKEKAILVRTYNKLYGKLKNSYWKRNKQYPVCFISHNIPFKTKLDVVKNKDSYVHKKHLGSSIARKFCEECKPLICIGGHIHECAGKDKIGKTLVVNTGFGRKSSVLIDIDEIKGKIRKVEFYKH
jgi:Icc-related predicted phosphoesterase